MFDGIRYRIRERLAKQVRVYDGDFWLRFRCDNSIESWRARSLLTKESGTVAWIRREAKPSDVFVDVGANIGLYTIMAAKRVAPNGIVYAFEPHLGNAYSLLRNCLINDVGDTVRIVSSALDAENRFEAFNYQAWIAGSSMSQFGTSVDDKGVSFQPVFAELKCGVPFDHLISQKVIRQPSLIKIDVDGNEMRVLQGMRAALSSAGLRTIQVEVGPRNASGVREVLSQSGFGLLERHDTDAGKRKIASGADPEAVAHNEIYERLPGAAKAVS